MNPDRLSRIEEIFHDLIAILPERRPDALAERCGDDAELRAEVELLLAGHSKAESEDFLIPPGSTAFDSRRGDSRSWWTRRALPGASVHIRCPNCNVATEVVLPDVPGQVTCPACHHSFQLPEDNWTGLPRGLLAGDKRKFGRFEILDLVGFGAFGNVYKAFDPTLQKIVALKVLRAGSHTRFIEDARSSAQLRHPSIVSAHEVSSHEETPFIVSDFIDGVTLAQWIRAGRPSFQETARLMKILAEALHYAHEKGVVHRDFKPTNIMIDRSGRPYLLDFGLAKREASEVTLTIDGQVLGTAAYMSPEQARGEAHKVDGKSDIYSLGVVLFEMLTGGPPFRGSLRMLLYQVLNDEPRPPRSINEQIPRDLETICLQCMSKEPSRRYQTAREVAEDFDNYLEDRPIRGRPVTMLERAGRWCRRNPRLATSLTITAASLLLVAVLSVAFARSRSVLLATSNTHLAEVNFELAKAACDRGEIGQGLHLFRRTIEAAKEAGNDDWVRVALANLSHWSRELPDLKAILSHKGWVWDAKFSPDGKRVVTASLDNTAILWDLATGLQIHEFRHQGSVLSVGFTRDGKTIVTASADKTARLFDSYTGQPIGDQLLHDDRVNIAVFSPDGKIVVTASKDKTARIWSSSTGRPLLNALQHNGSVNSVSISPDGNFVATGSDDKMARLWNLSTGKLIGEPLAHDETVWGVIFSHDGKKLLTYSEDKTARLWDVSTGRELRRFLHADEVFSVAFSPDDRTVATASKDHTAQIWDAESGQRRGRPMQHAGQVMSVEFSPNGETLATSCLDHSARIWEVATSDELGSRLRHASDVSNAMFSPDGTQLMTLSSDTTARVWELSTIRSFAHPLPRSGKALAGDLSPDGKSIVIGTSQGLAVECDSATGQERGLPYLSAAAGLPGSRVTAIAYRPDGSAVMIGNDQGFATLWRVDGRQLVGDLIKIEGAVRVIAFSPDSKSALVAGDAGRAQLVDAINGKTIGTPISQGRWIYDAIFSPDGKKALMASDDGSVTIWDTATGEPRGTLRHPKRVHMVTMSPDGKTVLTACQDGLVRRWDLETAKMSGRPLSHQGPSEQAIYSHDGRSILTASRNGTVRLWNSATGDVRADIPAMRHDAAIVAIVFSRDDKTIATASIDGTVRLWDVALARSIGPRIEHPKSVSRVSFLSQAGKILTRCDDLTLRLWDLPGLAEMPEQLNARVQMLTGLKLDDQGTFEVLDSDAWQMLRQGLSLRGGLFGAKTNLLKSDR